MAHEKAMVILVSSFIGRRQKKVKDMSTWMNEHTSESSSKISSHSISLIVDKLISQQNRNSTSKMYLCVWRQFNKFIMSLDVRPKSWEDRATLFIGYLTDRGMQSATVKSYVSVIKRTLIDDKYKWQDSQVLVSSLTRACRLVNDKVKQRLPIKCGLLELILFKVERICSTQWYLECMYKALFTISYYGLMRVGEVTASTHVLKASNVHLARNKEKILLILYTSKTHNFGDRLQKIKITANREEKLGRYVHRHFCPFKIMKTYLDLRGDYADEQEQFFVYSDKSVVTLEAARKILRAAIGNLNLSAGLYDMHSFRIGRMSDLAKFGYGIEEIKRMGRWKSNAVYKYIRL